MARTRPPFAEKPSSANLEQISRELQSDLVAMASLTQTPPPSEAAHYCDLLVALYWRCLRIDPKYPDSPSRDRLIFNDSQAVTALYVTLVKRGFFPTEELAHFYETGGHFPQHHAPSCAPGIEWACDSTAHGLSAGLGMALAAQIQSLNYAVYVLLDECACQDGVLWEAAELAPRLNLTNLTVIINTRRKSAATNGQAVQNFQAQKWLARGWSVKEVDGHDINAITETIQSPRPDHTPLAIFARTIQAAELKDSPNKIEPNQTTTSEKSTEEQKK